ncbi:unnamed protein product [Musa textilis]
MWCTKNNGLLRADSNKRKWLFLSPVCGIAPRKSDPSRERERESDAVPHLTTLAKRGRSSREPTAHVKSGFFVFGSFSQWLDLLRCSSVDRWSALFAFQPMPAITSPNIAVAYALGVAEMTPPLSSVIPLISIIPILVFVEEA